MSVQGEPLGIVLTNNPALSGLVFSFSWFPGRLPRAGLDDAFGVERLDNKSLQADITTWIREIIADEMD